MSRLFCYAFIVSKMLLALFVSCRAGSAFSLVPIRAASADRGKFVEILVGVFIEDLVVGFCFRCVGCDAASDQLSYRGVSSV